MSGKAPIRPGAWGPPHGVSGLTWLCSPVSVLTLPWLDCTPLPTLNLWGHVTHSGQCNMGRRTVGLPGPVPKISFETVHAVFFPFL